MSVMTPAEIAEYNNVGGGVPGTPGLGDLLNSAGGITPVANVTARNAIPAGSRFEGMLVQSLSSGIVSRLKADLTTWLPVANWNPALLEESPLFPGAGLPIHFMYVEAPGNGGLPTEDIREGEDPWRRALGHEKGRGT